jgi:Ca2+-transporting ATPase
VDREMWSGVLFIGAVMAAVTLLAIDLGLPGGLLEGDLDLTTARTMGFTTLVLAQLFNCFNARSDRASARHRAFANRALVAAIALSLALQVAVVHLPLMNDAFDTAPLSLADWLRCTALASVVLWASEARKLVVRAWARRGRGREAPGAGGARTEAR